MKIPLSRIINLWTISASVAIIVIIGNSGKAAGLDADTLGTAFELSSAFVAQISNLPESERFHAKIQGGKIVGIAGISSELRKLIEISNAVFPQFPKDVDFSEGQPVVFLPGDSWIAMIVVKPLETNPKKFTYAAIAIISRKDNQLATLYFPPG